MDYLFKTEPYQHQLERFIATRDREFYGFLWEMGSGKSKIVIDTSGWLYCRGEITGVLIVAPNGVHRNWIDQEYPTHYPNDFGLRSAYWVADPKKKEKEALEYLFANQNQSMDLVVLSMNVEALATKRGREFAEKFLLTFRCMMVVDESTTIKNPSAVRTKTVLKLGRMAAYRRILNGTPVTNNPLDIYTQFTFLDEEILRCSSYYAFRNRYAILKEMTTRNQPRSFKVVVGYQNIEELQRLIEPHSHRVRKEDCLDLPDKIYMKRIVEMTKKQASLYADVAKNLISEFSGMRMVTPLALTKILRLQQITGGFWCPEEVGEAVAIDGKNPRLDSLMEVLEDSDGKVIIWARFRAEIAQIEDAIRNEYGAGSLVSYHGGISKEDRAEAIARFQGRRQIIENGKEIDQARFFVANQQSAGMGLTLTAATTVVYYSNSFNYADRVQSEDRAHRIGQKHPVTYVDLFCPGTIDEKIMNSLRMKRDYAQMITGDNLQEWI